MYEFITFSKEALQFLFDIFPEIEKKCKYCNTEIDENNFGGLFSKPTRLSCNNVMCLSEAIDGKNDHPRDNNKNP